MVHDSVGGFPCDLVHDSVGGFACDSVNDSVGGFACDSVNESVGGFACHVAHDMVTDVGLGKRKTGEQRACLMDVFGLGGGDIMVW